MRFMAGGPGLPDEAAREVATPPTWLDRQPVELLGRPLGQRLAERWDDLRETWSQTTFFLFNPESWR
jgi:hypothetical protein